MVIIYTVAGVAGFALSSTAGAFFPLPILGGAGITIGASAAIFGLLGALVYYGRRSGSSMIRSEAMGYAITLFVMGVIMPGVDNFAHAGGFGGGYLASRLMDPLRPERIDHLLGAVICLALSVLSVLVSLVQRLPF
jgi:rhomboid protease GluP